MPLRKRNCSKMVLKSIIVLIRYCSQGMCFCLFIGNGPMIRHLPVRDNPDLELPLLLTKEDYCEDTNDEEEQEILYQFQDDMNVLNRLVECFPLKAYLNGYIDHRQSTSPRHDMNDFCSWEDRTLKETSSSENFTSVIYSPSCCSKPV